MNLIIVESPTKARTLSRFLGKEYEVVATMGHVRDLPKNKLGVDLEHDFAPEYTTLTDKKKSIETVKALSKSADKIYLATDPDREGEAIAWHISRLIGASEERKVKSEKLWRIVFHEITEGAIREALAHPRDLDMDLVSAQQARRILDRIVGYKLSPLLWKKVRRGLSAGRVQSVAVRIIVEREREIEKFKEDEYWRVFAAFHSNENIVVAELQAKDGKSFHETEKFELFAGLYAVSKTKIEKEKDAQTLILDFEEPFLVKAVEKKESGRHAPAPFTTSTLQQAAGRKFGMSARQTMRVAQNLYEEGLITYHRTDSTNLSQVAIADMRAFIERTYGREYLPTTPNFYKTKSRVAQEAHEAIRPTNVSMISNTEHVTRLGRDAGRLYELIWKQAVASQMAPARIEDTKVGIMSANDYEFRASGMRMVFPGWWSVAGVPREETILPPLKEGEEIVADSFGSTQHFTSPPPRYSEASLVAALEKEDIGRPSTYAPIISTILDRRYVEKVEGRFQPTPIGIAVNDFLVLNFPTIMDLPFTAILEEELDNIANGEKEWVPIIRRFWDPFNEKLETVEETSGRVKIPVEETGEKCSKCKIGMKVVRVGRFGKFLSCSRFPECDWKGQFIEKIGMTCPDCGKGEVIVRQTKRQRRFFGCSRYPKCKWASWRKPSNIN